MNVSIPNNFKPRDYQFPFWQAMMGGCKRAITVWHRRAGKDKTMFSMMCVKAAQKVGIYYYIFPTYSQGKKALWDAIDKDGFKVVTHMPEEYVKRKDNQNMSLELLNGSIIQIIGSENIDGIVGTNPIGIVYSEFSLQNRKAWDYMSPILRENGGWAVFNFTPRGENFSSELFSMACGKDILSVGGRDGLSGVFTTGNEEWFAQLLTIADTRVVNEEEIWKEVEAGIISEEKALQEYYCSFVASMEDAYFGSQLRKVGGKGRICEVSYDETLKVHTAWDLGMNDANSIIFYQTIGREVRVIDFYENRQEGLPHYAKVLQDKGYIYGNHYAPFDINVKELGSGRTRKETAKRLGIDFEALEKTGFEDGIETARGVLSNRCWFDGEKCRDLLNKLRLYTKESRKSNSKEHKEISNAADAFRYLSQSVDLNNDSLQFFIPQPVNVDVYD